MMMPGRKWDNGSKYRYGFNGKENDNEVKGEGNQQDYGMRIYDPRIGRFLSVDPLTKGFPNLTPYQFASNNPIALIDVDGLEGKKPLPKPDVIGSTYPKVKRLTSSDIENNLTALHVNGLSINYLKALASEEGLTLQMYDVDNGKEKIKLPAGRGGNATIGFGHLVHYGAIGSTQYDGDAITKEKEFSAGISIDQAFNILSQDLESRMGILRSGLRRSKIDIKDVPQGVVDLFMDLIYNTGSATTAMKIYRLNGVLGLTIGLNVRPKNKQSPKIDGLGDIRINNISNERRDMRLDLIKDLRQEENLKRSADDPRDASPAKKTNDAAVYIIRVKDGIILKIDYLKKHEMVLYFIS